MKKMQRLTVGWLLAALCLCGSMAQAATIAIPDSDAFGTAGTPPPGWRKVSGSGTWSSDGAVVTAGVNTYNLQTLYRGASGDSYTYSSAYPISFSVDMKPAVGQEESRVGFAFLCPGVTVWENGGQGYSVEVQNGTALSLRLYRDSEQWDGPRVLVANTSLTKSTYNTSFHNYKAVVTFQSGTTAHIEVFVDGASKLSYTDTAFLPKTIPYTSFICGLMNHQWPNYGTTQFDNWKVEYITPEPAVDNAAGATGVTPDSAWLNGTLTKTGSAATVWGIYYGTSDPGQTHTGWSKPFVMLGTNTAAPPVSHSYAATGLAEGQSYYYRYYATNAFGEVWANPAATFTTPLASPPPVILNADPTDIQTTSATLHGYLQSTGTQATAVAVLWGEENGADGGVWQNTNWWAAGAIAAESAVSTNIALLANKVYYYSFYATNGSGESRPATAKTFITGAVSIQGTANGSEIGPVDGAFTVTRPASCVGEPLTVYYSVDYTVANSATGGLDYAALPGSVTIAADQTAATIVVDVAADTRTEPTETVRLVLQQGLYPIGTGQAEITIANAPSPGGSSVWWRDRDGNTGATAGIWWDDIQYAVQSAQQGSAGAGIVKLCGDFERTATDTEGDIDIAAGGNIAVSGGWVWNGGAEPTVQSGRSKLDVRSVALGKSERVLDVASSSVRLENLEITGGNLTGTGRGAGIRASGASNLTVSNCVIHANAADCDYFDGGGGVRITGGGGHLFQYTLISNNTARVRGWGGGMYLDGTTSMTVEHSAIVDNLATYSSYDGQGGGICLINNAQLFMANCLIANNRCRGTGSAIYCATGNTAGGGGIVTAFGCLFTGNRHANDPSGTVVDVIRLGQTRSAGSSRVVNSTVVSNYQGLVTAAAQGSYPAGHFTGLQVLNSIIEGRNLHARGGDASGSNANTAHWTLQHSTMQATAAVAGYGMEAFVGGTWQWQYADSCPGLGHPGSWRQQPLSQCHGQRRLEPGAGGEYRRRRRLQGQGWRSFRS